jgi:hypothetical protein
MKETTNYNLKLPELTDYIDVSDFNHNFTVIDKEIIQKLNVSDLTYEQDGLTYLAKLVIEDGQPTIITSEINK